MGQAWIKSERGVGYVVCWLDETHTNKPLRNFGAMRSAAVEFRDWINTSTDERMGRWIRLYADTYKADELFSYPDIPTKGRARLIQQKQIY